MTNTKFRKRALLSSVAMMLVALVAIGSATFAWFATDPSVTTANSLHVTSSASTGILIMSESEHTIFAAGKASEEVGSLASDLDLTTLYDKSGIILNADYADTYSAANIDDRTHLVTSSAAKNLTIPLVPAATSELSYSTGAAWYTTKGTNADNYAKKDGETVNAVSLDTANNCYKEKIYTLRTDASVEETVKTAKVNWTGATDLAPSVRVAMLSKTGQLLAAWAPTGSTVNNYNGTAFGSFSGTAYVAKNASATLAAPQAVGTSDADTYVEIVVYIDGQDSTANSTNAAQIGEILSSLTVELSI